MCTENFVLTDISGRSEATLRKLINLADTWNSLRYISAESVLCNLFACNTRSINEQTFLVILNRAYAYVQARSTFNFPEIIIKLGWSLKSKNIFRKLISSATKSFQTRKQ